MRPTGMLSAKQISEIKSQKKSIDIPIQRWI
jgi:hypothetical protein